MKKTSAFLIWCFALLVACAPAPVQVSDGDAGQPGQPGRPILAAGTQAFPPAISANYWIDPQNVSTTASDNNGCTTNTTQCRTWARVASLLGTNLYKGLYIPIPTSTTIHFSSSQTANTDWINLNLSVNAAFILQCEAQTPLRTSTFTVTPRVRAPKASESSWIVTDATLALANGWSPFVNAGNLLVDTTQGLVTQLDFDLDTDTTAPLPKAARTQEWFNAMSTTPIAPTVVHGTPVNGDTYQVQPLCAVNLASVSVREGWTVNPDPAQNTGPRLTLYRIHAIGSQHFGTSFHADSTLVTIIESQLDTDVDLAGGTNFQFFNSRVTKGFNVLRGAKGQFYGLWIAPGVNVDEPGQGLVQGEAWLADDCAIAQQSLAQPFTPTLHVSSGGAVYIQVGFGLWAHGGNGIEIMPGGIVNILSGSVYGGYGDMKPGVFANALGYLTFPLSQTAANTFAVQNTQTTDCLVTASPTVYTVHLLASIGGYGVYDLGIQCTIANFDLAKTSGGLGGAALYPDRMAGIFQTSGIND